MSKLITRLIAESKAYQILAVWVESGGDRKKTYRKAVQVNR